MLYYIFLQLVQEFPIERVTIDKGKSGLGLSICAAKGVQSDFPGIYIKAVIKGGLADQVRIFVFLKVLKLNVSVYKIQALFVEI